MLDYSFNHYSYNKDKYHFCRPDIKGSKAYKSKIENHIKITKNLGNTTLVNFLYECIPIVVKYKFDIRFLDGGLKHSFVKIPRVNEELKGQKNNWDVIGAQPVETKDGLMIPGVGFFGNGSNVHMEGVLINNAGAVSVINSLDSIPIYVSSEYIYFNEDSVQIKKELRGWLMNCIMACEEITKLVS